MISELSMMEFRRSPGEYVNRAEYGRETFVLTRSGRQIAILTGIPKIGESSTSADLLIEIGADGSQRIATDA